MKSETAVLTPPVDTELIETVNNGHHVVENSGAVAVAAAMEETAEPNQPYMTIENHTNHPSRANKNQKRKTKLKTGEALARAVEGEDLVAQYLIEIGNVPLLTREQEISLSHRVQTGLSADKEIKAQNGEDKRSKRYQELTETVADGEIAAKEFTEANLRLVVSIAKHYTNGSGMPLLDIIQEGNLGLMHAVEKFDYKKGFKFSTYATWWIRQAITRGIAKKVREIKLPVYAFNALAKVSKAASELETNLGRQPTMGEVALRAGMDEDEVKKVYGYTKEPVSLSEPVGYEEDSELGDRVPDRTSLADFDKAEAASIVSTLLDPRTTSLTFEENVVLRLCFGLETGEPLGSKEVALHIGKHSETVLSIKKRAIEKLKVSAGVQAPKIKRNRKKAKNKS